ncbi:uncharacterized protein MAM_04071 [Metarhizium album ARSEF 1941]|uniref:Uncharacterized protein n=1 Tax=Metarhizium album (strain ARSEF 1941) TaxID=1081103 RepID=A0A0B2WZQ7_METAS|nr:uncharacterized protein MAM_04071 [Metarhizium album ARSEF 1941]KHN98310.1 hypothetical protein MAM_04071 [Metarhizium album ARSEF 1941]
MANLADIKRVTTVLGQGDPNNKAYRMQPPINLRRNLISAETSITRPVWTVFRRSKSCHDGSDSNTCEKGINTNVTNLAIILGILIPLIIATIVLIFLHRRNVRRLRQEDAQDPTQGLDFGIDEGLAKGAKRKSFFGIGGEKSNHKSNQLSMDMNLSSPYLLPPNIHQSHDSVHSLARIFPSDQDPYRTVGQYANSDAGSIRSFNPNGSRHGSMALSPSVGAARRMPPSRSDSMPMTPASPATASDPFATPTALEPLEPTHQPPRPGHAKDPARPAEPLMPEIGTLSYPDEKTAGLEMPDFEQPPVAVSRDSHYVLPDSSWEQDQPILAELPARSERGLIGTAHSAVDDFDFESRESHPSGLGRDMALPKIPSQDAPHAVQKIPGQALSQDDYGHPEILTSQYYDDEPLDASRPADSLPQPNDALGVPQQQTKRLSVGFRPLPPDDVMESEDPEYRANRIRSFYKEYFDDREPAPPLPGTGAAEYFEDYDAGYLGDAAYYDAETNAFVMPYAQPVTRRAMTPPPAGRFRGGLGGPGPRGGSRGPARGPHGSIGGMSLPGGPGRPRAGSAFGPRPGSSASAQIRGRPPKKNLPPPTALHTLPTPSKLKDDSFAIFHATDFAPPDSFREHVAGRSQSPLGERRAYSPRVPIASPLVTSFDELSVLPSPHLLRKSSTFTNLDFAPPKKFKEADNMSDAGSIRSNNSGISAAQLHAIRGGAGRISRLPGDTVFTSAALEDKLKPQWVMRS